MNAGRVPVAVLGATGLVGQHFARLLADHPWFAPVSVAASARSAGRRYEDAVAWAIGGRPPEEIGGLSVDPVDPGVLARKGVRIVFSALPAAAAGPIESALRDGGMAVFTNASARRMDADVPIVVPEINPGHLRAVSRREWEKAGFVVAGSNCSAAGLALSLAPFAPAGIRRAACVTYQSASGAGARGLAWLKEPDASVIPFIRDEEEKLARETRKIFGRSSAAGFDPASFEVEAACARVPVREGHLLYVTIELEQTLEQAEAEGLVDAFRGHPQARGLPMAPSQPLVLRPEADRPQPGLDAWAGGPGRSAGMAVSIGRLRAAGRKVRFFALVHNLIRGAAGLCLLNAELALRQGLIAGASQAGSPGEEQP